MYKRYVMLSLKNESNMIVVLDEYNSFLAHFIDLFTLGTKLFVMSFTSKIILRAIIKLQAKLQNDKMSNVKWIMFLKI
jgi:hypothetical protein